MSCTYVFLVMLISLPFDTFNDNGYVAYQVFYLIIIALQFLISNDMHWQFEFSNFQNPLVLFYYQMFINWYYIVCDWSHINNIVNQLLVNFLFVLCLRIKTILNKMFINWYDNGCDLSATSITKWVTLLKPYDQFKQTLYIRKNKAGKEKEC